jgi:hypothetical protein
VSTESIRSRLKQFGEKLPEQGRDEYYANTTARLDTIIGDSGVVWAQINRAKTEYGTVDGNKESFYVWLKETYGIKLQFTPDGDLQLENEIVDEQKYTIFLLKFGE